MARKTWMRFLCGGLDGAGGGFDVFALAAGERTDARAADFAGDGVDGVEVAGGGDGEAGFDDVDAEAASWWAKRSFSAWCMVQPGDCSPSRRVVSKKTIWSGLAEIMLAIGSTDASVWTRA